MFGIVAPSARMATTILGRCTVADARALVLVVGALALSVTGCSSEASTGSPCDGSGCDSRDAGRGADGGDPTDDGGPVVDDCESCPPREARCEGSVRVTYGGAEGGCNDRTGACEYPDGDETRMPCGRGMACELDGDDQPTCVEYEHPFYTIASEMEPGEFRRVETTLPDGVESIAQLNRVHWHPDIDELGPFGVGWTDRTLFDPETGRLFNVLMRGSSPRSMTWLEPDLSWTGVLEPEGAGLAGRRPYNRFMDGADGYMYFAPSMPNEEVGRLTRAPYSDPTNWEDVGAPPLPVDVSGHAVGDYSTIWHPDIEKFVLYIWGSGRGDLSDEGIDDYQQGRTFVWGPGDAEWTRPETEASYDGLPGRTQSSGYGGTTIYNPIRHEVLIYGGSANWSDPHPLGPQCTATIDRNGVFRRHGPSGVVYSTGSVRLTYNPVTGDYILLRDHSREMYVGDPPRGKPWELLHDWHDVEGRPFDRYEVWHRVTPLPGTDVLIWSDLRRGIILQRMPATD